MEDENTQNQVAEEETVAPYLVPSNDAHVDDEAWTGADSADSPAATRYTNDHIYKGMY